MLSQESIISVRQLVKRFDSRTVLAGVDLEVMPGEIMVVMGGSGSGKSTLLRHMIGALRPDEGSVMLLGRDLSEVDEDGMNRLRRQFGILFQSGALFQSMTVAENVALPLQEHTTLDQNIIDIQVKIKLELVGLREHATKYPAQISGGMKKRAGLARALALDPKILFYDEPSAGLDPVTSAGIDKLIIDLTRKLGVTSVVVTHEMDSAFAIADRMAMLDKGRMLVVAERSYFEDLRDRPADGLCEDKATVRQFVRGDAEGPITQRREVTNYAEALIGLPEPRLSSEPSVQPTRIAK
ncbi:MAG: ATP-binding cassette domain-containing protein [Planctomycetes bacterium]|nr:ATP-binding cassette domain-containing protein [Planctomycetota bacterium]NOG55030.1 ATP-binding cassette domain-containing protein [Planctomycetota bacterium]